MTSPTPEQLLALARAAMADGTIDFQVPRLGIFGFVSHQKFHEACTPEVVAALCERLRECCHDHPDEMKKPLTHE